MILDSELIGHVLRVAVNEARIDAAVAVQFRDCMHALVSDAPARVLLDLSRVDFIDSSGLGAIVGAMKLLGPDRRLELVGLAGAVDKVFRLTRMDTVFTIHADIDSALRAPADAP